MRRLFGGIIGAAFFGLCGGLLGAPFQVSVRWLENAPSGEVVVARGTVRSLAVVGGEAMGHDGFRFPEKAPGRLDLTVDGETGNGLPTLVTVSNARRTFTFRPSDVSTVAPIYLPGDHVIVTPADDPRSAESIVAALQTQSGRSKLQQIATEPEESFADASRRVRDTQVQTWLGVSRDYRIFRVEEHLDWIRPHLAGWDSILPESPGQQIAYQFGLGRGWGPRDLWKRRLDEDVLPILHATLEDEGIHYELTLLASLEQQTLTASHIIGTDYLIADSRGHGRMLTPAQAAELERRRQAEPKDSEETVLYGRAVATNRGHAPHYAYFRLPSPVATVIGKPTPVSSFDPRTGQGSFSSGRVYVTGRLNGQPASGPEAARLLQPGETAVLEFQLPHTPISRERALRLAEQSFSTRLAEARAFWRSKLNAAATWRLPEPRIDAMVRAGLLHLDLVAYGREPEGPVLPAVGIYTAIGSESAPIIQFMDSMGWHDTARRAIDYFLEKQHDNGFMQNFNGYMLETGAVLWTMGEHYRYTRDEAWLRRVHPRVTLACDYLQAWRRRNLQPGLAGDGYGMLDGKTADPEDPYRSFMLSGYAYLGLVRSAEMLAGIAPDESARWRKEADSLKQDVRASLKGSMERAPVVPLGDGTWSRTAAPWTGYRGPVALQADGGNWYTHGTMTARDSLLGPLYLVFQEVLEPGEVEAGELLRTHNALMLTPENVAFSQPYYSRHPWVHLKRGEPKAFLKAWYNSVAALADRETFTFTEHFFPVSAHKTHEEAWFLMETRWMLYLEEGDTLRLLAGVPRDYLAAGRRIQVDRAASYFGPISFQVEAVSCTEIRASVECHGTRLPTVVEFRLPHPEGRRPVSVEGGRYDPDRESVFLPAVSGRSSLVLRY